MVGPAEDRVLQGMRLPREAVLQLTQELMREGLVIREGLGVRLATHRVQVSRADALLWEKIEPLLAQGALRPPTLTELSVSSGIDAKKLEAALSRLARHGRVIRVSKNRFFLPASLAQLEEIAQQMEEVTAAAFRDRSGIGRNLAIEVLEFFDRIKFTRRVGDAHVVVHGRDSHPGGAHGLQIR
jgi:selenocysteine-specific elongation factor